jgi:hypothetical protein
MYRTILASVALMFFALAAMAADPTDAMIARVPESANAIVVIDVNTVFKTPMAQREGWSSKLEAARKAGVEVLPADTQNIVIASFFNLPTMTPLWQLGQFRQTSPVQIRQLATKEQGRLDEVGGESVVLSPRNLYYAGLSPHELGVVHPANRQLLSRWIRQWKQADKPRVSPYLAQAVTTNRQGAPVFFAIDTTDFVDVTVARRNIEFSKTLAGKDVDKTHVAYYLTAMRGISLSVNFNEEITGVLRVDFSREIPAYGSLLKPLLLELLNDQGAHLDDFNAWTVRFRNNTMTMEGKLSKDELKQLVSMFGVPLPETYMPADPSLKGDPKLIATKRYYRALTVILEELRAKKPRNYNDNALRHETASRKIDQLPIVEVDRDLLDYGYQVASQLRLVAASLRGIPIELSALEQSKTIIAHGENNWFPGYWFPGWGYYYPGSYRYETNIPEVNAKQADVIVKGEKSRNEIWRSISDAMAAARRKMAEKYMSDF